MHHTITAVVFEHTAHIFKTFETQIQRFICFKNQAGQFVPAKITITGSTVKFVFIKHIALKLQFSANCINAPRVAFFTPFQLGDVCLVNIRNLNTLCEPTQKEKLSVK